MPHKSFLLKFCVAGILSLCIVGSACGQEPDPPVCKRTLQVQNAIVPAIDGVSICSEVTSTQLAAITFLSITGTDITELKSGDFAGLTNTNLVLTIIHSTANVA